MSDEAWQEFNTRTGGMTRYADNSNERDVFEAGFAAGEAESKPVVDLMRSLSINPAIPQGFRSLMKSALDQ